MPESQLRPPESLLGGLYAIDPARPLPNLGGLACFAARREKEPADLVAIEVAPGMPPRCAALEALLAQPVPGVLSPLAHGPAMLDGRRPAYFVICPAPPGPALDAEPRPWTEGEVLRDVLRPAAATLARLEARLLTHRAIRPDNLFQSQRGEPVVLGPAWAAPPASDQPALYEPPYVAMCHLAGRGDGTIADDIYALGVVLLVLALGRNPLAGLDEAEIIRRKLAFGSFAALANEARLPETLAEILRAMLADDPLQRPSPTALADQAAHRIRRQALRPPRRAAEPLVIGTTEVFEPRSLAHALHADSAQSARLLRLGVVDRWLRRHFGDAALAHRVEELVRRSPIKAATDNGRADALLVMLAVAFLDPLAPVCWRGIAFWPNGLGPMLAEGSTEPVLIELVEAEAIGLWATARPERADAPTLRLEARQYRSLLRRHGWAGGPRRLCHALNPLLACRSPLVGARVVVQLPALLTALEAAASQPESRSRAPIDAEVAAFILARGGAGLEANVGRLSESAEAGPASLAALKLFACLQGLLGTGPLPGLANWLAERAAPLLAGWKQLSRRTALKEALSRLAGQGNLTGMLAALEDPEARTRDAEGMRQAEAAIKRIDAELNALAEAAGARAETALRLGQEIAAGIGLAAVASTLLLLAFG